MTLIIMAAVVSPLVILIVNNHIQGVPGKASHFQNEITLEISGQNAQFRCFGNAKMHSYFLK